MAYQMARRHGLPVIGTRAGRHPERVLPDASLSWIPASFLNWRGACAASSAMPICAGPPGAQRARARTTAPTWQNSAEILRACGEGCWNERFRRLASLMSEPATCAGAI